jgi:DNA invertase Pin-like site-specific DNA recombinase
MANAVKKGVKIGRPVGRKSKSSIDEHRKDIMDLIAVKSSKSLICRIVGCSRGTLVRFLKSEGIE